MDYRVFISVDMEGITGVISWDETEVAKHDYEYFRKLMTQEANAAIEGAIEAGATEVVVRDAHCQARNLLPDMLHEDAKLLREWSKGPYMMMEGIDDYYHAVIFVGYHAKAGTPSGTLKHTMSGSILDLRVNDVSLPELGWNGLIAGYHNVPVIFISGDQAVCSQAKTIFNDIETVVVKQGIGMASLNLHPKKSQQLIREGVKRAMERLSTFKPLKFNSPYKVEIQYKNEDKALVASWYPGVKRIGDLGVVFECEDFMDAMRFFLFVSH